MKKIISCLFALVLVLTVVAGCAKTPEVTATITDISKYGHLILDITGADLFSQGYEHGDVLEVTVAGQAWDIPLCSNYGDVENGMPVLRAATEQDVVVLAINMGNFATDAGIAAKETIEQDPGFRWNYLIETPVQIEITMKQEDGYREQWLIHQLVRTNERSDYTHLSDEAFANFRVIDTTGMGENTLYRSSSPINPALGRSAYADQAAKNAGIKTIINLADPSNTYEGTENTHYQTCQVVYLNLGTEFVSDEATASLARGMRFIINGEAPYLLHCNEGKDRTGFVSALLECLMGATIDEVAQDYMETYANYYGVEVGSQKYEAILNRNLIEMLNKNFQVDDVYQADLAAEAQAFLTEEVGLSEDEVTALKAKLGGTN